MRLSAICGTLLTLLGALPAMADDAPFLGTDPASVPAQGEKSVQQWVSWGHGQNYTSYNAFETQTEFDYGLTDDIQLAISLLYDWSRRCPHDNPKEYSSLVGVAGEAVYVVMPTDTSPLGLALAVDPAFSPNSRGIAFRLLFTKYFSRFENVLNINFENNWNKDEFGHWQGSSGIAFNYGLGHALDKHWTIALEFGNEFSFDSLLTSSNLRNTATTYFLGPTVQYDSDFATISFGVQTQLPIADGDKVANGYAEDAERWRMGLRVAHAI